MQKQYTPNQVAAIKKLQWLSYADEEFQTLTGHSEMKFNDVVRCGTWSLEALEEMGAALNSKKTQSDFSYLQQKRVGKKRASKIPSNQQFQYQARSLNKRDKGLIRRDKDLRKK